MSDKQNRQRPVYVYLAILFTVAIVLTLYSFLMTHRNSQQILRELKDNNNILQSTLQENNDLEARVEELEVELSQAQQALRDAQAEDERHQQNSTAMICAMDWLREIEREYGAKRYSAARERIEGFEENNLPQHLPAGALHTNPDGSDAIPPAESYNAIVEALFPNGLVS